MPSIFIKALCFFLSYLLAVGEKYVLSNFYAAAAAVVGKAVLRVRGNITDETNGRRVGMGCARGKLLIRPRALHLRRG